MGRGNWRPSRDWPAFDFLHFDIPMLAYDDHLKEFGDEGWKKNQFELEERTRDYFNHFMEQIPTILPPSFYKDDRPRQGEHVLYSNSLCHIIFAEEDTYYAVAVVARDDLHEYGDTTLEPLAVAYVERHGRRILDKLARLYPSLQRTRRAPGRAPATFHRRNHMNENTIENAAKRKAKALQGLFNATEQLVSTRADLEAVTVYFTNLGLEGTNEKSRAADLATKTAEERADVAEAEKNVREARLELDLANNELERIRLLLRLEEVAVGTPA